MSITFTFFFFFRLINNSFFENITVRIIVITEIDNRFSISSLNDGTSYFETILLSPPPNKKKEIEMSKSGKWRRENVERTEIVVNS